MLAVCVAVFFRKSLKRSCLLSGWRQLSPFRTETAARRICMSSFIIRRVLWQKREAALISPHVLSAAHKTPGIQFVTTGMALTREFEWM